MAWTSTPVGCPLQNYFLFTLTLESDLMLVLGSFDRFCSSSRSTRIRSNSSIRIAKQIIVVTILLCFLYLSPMLIILYYDPAMHLCIQYLDAVSYAYTLSQMIVYHVLISLLLVVFGTGTNRSSRRTDGQLA